jgi:transcriptional regulator with XRE-family HTH domain
MSMPSKTDIGRQMIKHRRLRGMTQAELARLSGIAREDICRYEAGEKDPSLRNTLRIAKALGVSLDALV